MLKTQMSEGNSFKMVFKKEYFKLFVNLEFNLTRCILQQYFNL